ncbi:polyketide cyclase/dehydrase and lipid transport [Spiribacter salinus M19-40]|jgi:hypothetical protein|uniref:Polyketide cyclase/dehydrase and lipid transport n=1 Tax=Spiribacter salinus M19-40 TaxID=1260251 RepID=R4VMX7_9GAMM|nr:SRPBCC family protein [Spiribacter salinus]AGM41762.1 polyketide cyclase/dehydrase and lipid transport [Spiribacter salinus M19-40]MBY5268688.1 polyketide cyclase [Spiribacter salinus]
MVRTSASALINRASPVVFSFVVDDFVQNYPRWSPEVKSLKPLSDGPLVQGWKARQVRVDQGRRTATDFEVIALKPPEHVGFQGIKDPYFIDFHFAAATEDSTQLTFVFELGQLGMAFKPFEKLIKHAVQSGVDRVARNLKYLVESETPSG